MPNYCYNSLSIRGSNETLTKIYNLIHSDDNELDFEKIIPLPDYIYRGPFGPKEEKIYGKNNWYDWSCEHWGTKWNSEDAQCEWFSDSLELDFQTAWSPCEPIIKELAAIFPDAKFFYRYFEDGMCFCGQQEYENGHMTYEAYGDYYEHWFINDDEDEPREKEEPGLFYSTNDEKDLDPAITYNFTYRDTDNERSITIEGFCCDARAERKPFVW